MSKDDSYKMVISDEFENIFKRFEGQLDKRCLDLHSIQLALRNLPDMKEVKMPNPFITYFLKKSEYKPQDIFVTNTYHNVESIIYRTNNLFAQNIFYLAEEHLIEGIILLKLILSQTSISFASVPFKEQFNKELNKVRKFGNLEEEIKKLVNKSGTDIIPVDCPYYSYLENYVILRNCLTHREGKITEKEKKLEIRLPYISKEQIDSVKKEDSKESLNPQMIFRKWDLGDKVELSIQEVEGIALGLVQTLFQIFKHMYTAADRYVEKLEKK